MSFEAKYSICFLIEFCVDPAGGDDLTIYVLDCTVQPFCIDPGGGFDLTIYVLDCIVQPL